MKLIIGGYFRQATVFRQPQVSQQQDFNNIPAVPAPQPRKYRRNNTGTRAPRTRKNQSAAAIAAANAAVAVVVTTASSTDLIPIDSHQIQEMPVSTMSDTIVSSTGPIVMENIKNE
uniref:Uncharacterized protein n=1 Tax=Panagrolaimus superbus TaxID=310955 RepID=A0A914Y4X6_9BILA